MHTLRVLAILASLLLATSTGFSLTKSEALLVLGREVLTPSASTDVISAWMTPAPLSGGVIETRDGDVTIDLDAPPFGGTDHWFAYVDLQPCAFLEHPVSYVLISDAPSVDTAVVTVVPADNWPTLDSVTMADGPAVGGRRILIYSAVPRPDPIATGNQPEVADVDFGDAPDGQLAYPGVLGKFPTFLTGPNALPGRSGAHAGVPSIGTEDTIGRTISTEISPVDPGDPDGVPNLVDADADERVFFTYDTNVSPPTSHLIYDLTIAPGAPPDTIRYVNVAVDLDQDGAWQGGPAPFREWVVVNQTWSPAGPGTETRISPAFDWTSPAVPAGPTLAWARVVLSRAESIDPAIFGAQGWDGSGSFASGEVEDFKFYRKWCPGIGCPPPPDPDGDDDDDDDVPPETKPPVEPVGWDGLPVNKFALVVQGIDNPGEVAARQAATQMERLFKTQGYQTTRLDGNRGQATTRGIKQWFEDTKSKVKCQDKVVVYFIAHGKSGVKGGRMTLQEAGSDADGMPDDGLFFGDELADALDLIPPCPPFPDNDCATPNVCCDVTVLIESCFSGQFLDSRDDPDDEPSGPGRRIITSSEGSTPSYFGEDGTGGAWSDIYTDCADVANAGSVDGADGSPPDCIITVQELAEWAKAGIGDPYGQRQKPQGSDETCDCQCPPFWWDCLCDQDPFDFIDVVFFPGQLFGEGGPIGASFGGQNEGIVPLPGFPLYDHVHLPEDPRGWQWSAILDCLSAGVLQLVVNVQGIEPGVDVFMPLFCLNPAAFEGPLPDQLFVTVDLAFNQYFIEGGSFFHAGSWSEFAEDLVLLPELVPVPIYRANRPPGPDREQLQVEAFGGLPGDAHPKWINLQWTPAPSESNYFIEMAPDADTWLTIAGPLINTSYTLPFDPSMGSFFRVRRETVTPP